MVDFQAAIRQQVLQYNGNTSYDTVMQRNNRLPLETAASFSKAASITFSVPISIISLSLFFIQAKNSMCMKNLFIMKVIVVVLIFTITSDTFWVPEINAFSDSCCSVLFRDLLKHP
jgi:ammonia channel protein AmtB